MAKRRRGSRRPPPEFAHHDREPPGHPRPEAPDAGRRDRFGLALIASIAAGLLYGLGHALFTVAVMDDPSTPAMAGLAPVFGGLYVGIIALPAFAAVVVLLMLQRAGLSGFVGDWLRLGFASGTTWVLTFFFTLAAWETLPLLIE